MYNYFEIRYIQTSTGKKNNFVDIDISYFYNKKKIK